jgi:hypothetical protein
MHAMSQGDFTPYIRESEQQGARLAEARSRVEKAEEHLRDMEAQAALLEKRIRGVGRGSAARNAERIAAWAKKMVSLSDPRPCLAEWDHGDDKDRKQAGQIVQAAIEARPEELREVFQAIWKDPLTRAAVTKRLQVLLRDLVEYFHHCCVRPAEEALAKARREYEAADHEWQERLHGPILGTFPLPWPADDSGKKAAPPSGGGGEAPGPETLAPAQPATGGEVPTRPPAGAPPSTTPATGSPRGPDDVPPWCEDDLRDKPRVVRKLLAYVWPRRPRVAVDDNLAQAVWSESLEILKPQALKSAVFKTNKFLSEYGHTLSRDGDVLDLT